MKKDWTFNLLIILLLAGLAFLLYSVTGGDLTYWLDSRGPGRLSASFLDDLTNSMRSVSDGITNAFGRLRP